MQVEDYDLISSFESICTSSVRPVLTSASTYFHRLKFNRILCCTSDPIRVALVKLRFEVTGDTR